MIMNPEPLVSIIMPCYNAERFLKKAIESMLNQTFTDFEFIIIDDCSTDRSAAIIHEYIKDDPRIRYIKNDKNRGVASSLNIGINNSNGKFIARMDADDISAPERLKKQIEHMKNNPDCVACGSDIIIINEHGSIIGSRKYLYSNKTIKKNIHRASCFAHPTVIIRAETLRNNGLLYSISLPWVEDFDLWFKLSEHGEFSNLEESLLYYRLSSSSVKNSHCKESLRNTIRLKVMNMSHATILSCFVLCAEIILYLLPAWIILFLYEMRYSSLINSQVDIINQGDTL